MTDSFPNFRPHGSNERPLGLLRELDHNMTLIEYWLNGSGPVSLTQRTTSDETMVATPPIGSSGGQRFDTVAAIRNILGNMGAGPGFCCGAVLVKELIQNADDA